MFVPPRPAAAAAGPPRDTSQPVLDGIFAEFANSHRPYLHCAFAVGRRSDRPAGARPHTTMMSHASRGPMDSAPLQAARQAPLHDLSHTHHNSIFSMAFISFDLVAASTPLSAPLIADASMLARSIRESTPMPASPFLHEPSSFLSSQVSTSDGPPPPPPPPLPPLGWLDSASRSGSGRLTLGVAGSANLACASAIALARSSALARCASALACAALRACAALASAVLAASSSMTGGAERSASLLAVLAAALMTPMASSA